MDTQFNNSDSFIMDVIINTDHIVKIIEINCFGGETGAGSAGFHWKHDEHILYSNGENVVFRVFQKPNSLKS